MFFLTADSSCMWCIRFSLKVSNKLFDRPLFEIKEIGLVEKYFPHMPVVVKSLQFAIFKWNFIFWDWPSRVPPRRFWGHGLLKIHPDSPKCIRIPDSSWFFRTAQNMSRLFKVSLYSSIFVKTDQNIVAILCFLGMSRQIFSRFSSKRFWVFRPLWPRSTLASSSQLKIFLERILKSRSLNQEGEHTSINPTWHIVKIIDNEKLIMLM